METEDCLLRVPLHPGDAPVQHSDKSSKILPAQNAAGDRLRDII